MREYSILEGDQAVEVFDESGSLSQSDPFGKILEYSRQWRDRQV